MNLLGSLDYRSEFQTQYRNTYDLYNYKTDVYVTNKSTSNENSYRTSMAQYRKPYGKLQLDYAKVIGDHSFNAMFATEISQTRDDMLAGKRRYEGMFTFHELNQATASTATNEGTHAYTRYVAFIGRVNYDYKDKYLLEAMLRRDGSYKYSPQKMWATFPSVSVGWRVSEESFIKNRVSWLSNLKLRASYGSSGTDQTGDYYYEWMPAYTNDPLRGYTFDGTNWTSGMVPPGVVNDLQSWVHHTILNVGVDITVLRNLDITFEGFERRNTGILANRVVTTPNTFGASLPRENINSTLNNGLELDVRYRGSAGDFKYTLEGNVTFSRQKRLHTERAPFSSQWERWRADNNNSSDRYVGRLNIYTWDGRYTSLQEYETAPLLSNGGNLGNSMMLPGSYRIEDNNGDGRINSDDQVYDQWDYSRGWARVNPPLQFGFNFDFAYKAWDLAFTLQGASLYSVAYRHDDTMGYGERYPTSHKRFLDRWHTTDPTADPFNPAAEWTPGKYPAGRPNFNNTTDGLAIDVWRPNATYLRLKNIELGYTIPKEVLTKINIQQFRVYVNATNMLTFAKEILKEIDPEKHEGEYENSLSYPLMKSLNFGVNVTF